MWGLNLMSCGVTIQYKDFFFLLPCLHASVQIVIIIFSNAFLNAFFKVKMYFERYHELLIYEYLDIFGKLHHMIFYNLN